MLNIVTYTVEMCQNADQINGRSTNSQQMANVERTAPRISTSYSPSL